METAIITTKHERRVVFLNNASFLVENIQSDVLKEFMYFASLTDLDIQFNSGSVYRYKNVPLIVAYGLLASESAGEFYNKNVRKNYEWEKLR
jgi:hypothetical protein